MAKSASNPPGALGFRVKTGRATAILLAGTSASPRILGRRSVDLCDPKVPDSRQPYHAALGLSEKDAALVVRRATEAVRAVAHRAVRDLKNQLHEQGHDLRAIGLVVGSDLDPAKLANAHVRAHALEGRLFREVLEAGASACEVPCFVLVEREAYEKAAPELGRRPEQLKDMIAELGKAIGRPWTSEEKAATLAAWLALNR